MSTAAVRTPNLVEDCRRREVPVRGPRREARDRTARLDEARVRVEAALENDDLVAAGAHGRANRDEERLGCRGREQNVLEAEQASEVGLDVSSMLAPRLPSNERRTNDLLDPLEVLALGVAVREVHEALGRARVQRALERRHARARRRLERNQRTEAPDGLPGEPQLVALRAPRQQRGSALHVRESERRREVPEPAVDLLSPHAKLAGDVVDPHPAALLGRHAVLCVATRGFVEAQREHRGVELEGERGSLSVAGEHLDVDLPTVPAHVELEPAGHRDRGRRQRELPLA